MSVPPVAGLRAAAALAQPVEIEPCGAARSVHGYDQEGAGLTQSGQAAPRFPRHGRGVEHELRACVEDLRSVRAGLEPELDPQVESAEHERVHPRLRRELVREAEAHRSLHERDEWRAVRVELLNGPRRRLREDERVDRESGERGEILLEQAAAGRVDAHDPERVALQLREHAGDEGPRRFLLGRRDAVLEIGDHRIRGRAERLPQLVLLASRGEEERAGAHELRRNGHQRLTESPMSDINTSLSRTRRVSRG